MINKHKEFLLRVMLLAVTVLFGAGLFAASNYPVHYRAAAAAVPLAERDYSISLPSPPDVWHNAFSFDETMHVVGAWGCRLRTAMPSSILQAANCFY